MATKDGTPKVAEQPSPEAKRKTISNSLLTMKFMQKGQDAELSSKLQQQRLKEVSDQQWRLSVIADSVMRVPSSATEIYHEPSYSAYESGLITKSTETGERVLNRGRKTYGSFVPDVEEFLETARGISSNGDESVESTNNPLKRTKVPSGSQPAKKTKRAETGKS